MSNIIALDIGRVCVGLNYQGCAEKLGLKSEEELAKVSEIWELNDRMERGEIGVEQFVEELKALFPEHSTAAIVAAWQTIIGEEIIGMREVVMSLVRQGFEIVFLSNTSALHFKEVSQKLSFFDQVKGAVLSFEVGAMKPEGEIYKHFEEKYTRPKLFIDDKEENILAAQKRDWQCYQMGDVRELNAMIARSLI